MTLSRAGDGLQTAALAVVPQDASSRDAILRAGDDASLLRAVRVAVAAATSDNQRTQLAHVLHRYENEVRADGVEQAATAPYISRENADALLNVPTIRERVLALPEVRTLLQQILSGASAAAPRAPTTFVPRADAGIEAVAAVPAARGARAGDDVAALAEEYVGSPRGRGPYLLQPEASVPNGLRVDDASVFVVALDRTWWPEKRARKFLKELTADVGLTPRLMKEETARDAGFGEYVPTHWLFALRSPAQYTPDGAFMVHNDAGVSAILAKRVTPNEEAAAAARRFRELRTAILGSES